MGTVHVLWSSTNQKHATNPHQDNLAAADEGAVHFNQPGGFTYLQPQRANPLPAANSEITARMHRLNHLVTDALTTPRKRTQMTDAKLAVIEAEMADILSRLRYRIQG